MLKVSVNKTPSPALVKLDSLLVSKQLLKGRVFVD